jgi:alpha-ketoglutarate-dependent taurine dioxygenase
MNIIPSGDAPLGAEIAGLDLGEGWSDDIAALVQQALHEHKVVVLRNQRLAQRRRFSGATEHVLDAVRARGAPGRSGAHARRLMHRTTVGGSVPY